jgi:DNA-binding transcriptional LysR family regulator
MDDREFFFNVVEAKGFAAAAKRLETTAASVSRRIKSLEQRLGVRLLNRTTRNISLTEAGEQYYREGRRLWRELGELEHRLRDSSLNPHGELRIVAPMSFGQQVLAPLVTQFAAMYRQLRVVSLILDDRETDLINEAVDLAIRIGYPADSSMVARPISSITRYVCASPDYFEQHGLPGSPRDLLDHDCLHYNVISEREEWTFHDEEGEQTLAIKGIFCSNNGDVLAEAAIQGLGIALLPGFIVEKELRQGRLVAALEQYQRSPMTLYALYTSRHHLPAKTRVFLEYLQKNLGPSEKFNAL